ncbi:unnamed protein product, partial [Brenthis ino]
MALNHPSILNKFIKFPNTPAARELIKQNFYNKYGIPGVADEKCHILAINPKFGGASHDAFVWENSQLNTYMQTLHRNGESVWLPGDSGYPQRPWLMTPYNNPAPGSAGETFNKLHSRARVTIENTFGRLKNRWRCLCKDRVLHYKPEKCAQIILACSVLHNIALDLGVPDPQEQTIVNNQDFPENDEVEDDVTLLKRARGV